jgi:hypothetical protein
MDPPTGTDTYTHSTPLARGVAVVSARELRDLWWGGRG